MIQITELQKRYGDVTAVEDVSFEARPGEIFGLLGPNGAGKSTTLGCISGLLKPSKGSVTVLGMDAQLEPTKVKSRLGLVPQELALYEDLSAQENLEFFGAAWGLGGARLRDRVSEVLDRIGLEDRRRDRVTTFSGGMKRRLNFACGLVHEPDVLLLDEPTVGVDPQSRVKLLDLVREEAERGRTVLYTTHYMEEAESLCDRLAIVDRGRVIACGTLQELSTQLAERELVRLGGHFDVAAIRSLLPQVPEWAEAEIVQVTTEHLVLAKGEASRKLPSLFSALANSGAVVRETVLTRPSLESLFIKLTGKELRE